VDCKGCIKEWIPGQIIRKQLNLVRVHYIGWPNQWDEWLDVNLGYVLPLGTKTNIPPTDKFYIGQEIEVIPIGGTEWTTGHVHQIQGHNVCVWIKKSDGIGYRPLWYNVVTDNTIRYL
jgi:hypothetical protein